MDLINRPRMTQLLKLASRKGIATISGVEMFVPQGVAQWELWTGQRAPESLMRKANISAVAQNPGPYERNLDSLADGVGRNKGELPSDRSDVVRCLPEPSGYIIYGLNLLSPNAE